MSPTQLTKNFNSNEFDCKCGKCHARINLDFVKKLQELRDICGFPLPIASGVRCATHNAAVGGAPASRHLYGDAADITWTQMDGTAKLCLIKMATRVGFTGFGIASTFLHLDMRAGDPVVWTYGTKE